MGIIRICDIGYSVIGAGWTGFDGDAENDDFV